MRLCRASRPPPPLYRIRTLALPALLGALYRQVDGTSHLRDKSLAQFVASNKLTETRIKAARSKAVFKGKRSGVTTFAQRDWYWWLESTATEVENFYRLEIRVALAENLQDQPLHTLVAFSAGKVAGEGDG